MAKSKKENNELENPFGGFTVMNGGIVKPNDSDEDEIIDGDNALLEDDELSDDEKERLAEADKKLLEIANKTTKKLKGEVETEEEESEEDIESDDEKNKDSLLRVFVKSLHDKNVIDFDDSDDEFEDSEEGIEKLVNKTVESRINKWVEALPDEYSKFLDFVQNGGKPKDFLNVYYGNHSWKEFDLSTEEKQRLVAEESLRLTGETEEDIKEIVDEWVDNGVIEKRAKSGLTKLQKFEDIQKEQLIEQNKAKAAKQKEEELNYWNTFKKDLFAKEEIKGFKLTPKLKEKLWDHMTAVDKKTGKTAYQQALDNDTEASLLFALQSMNNFDISKLEKQVESKVSNKFNSLLKNYSKTSKEKISSGTTQQFEGDDPFKEFKKMKI